MRTNSRLGNWLPVVFWTGIIVIESGFGSSANTGSVLERIARWLFGNVDPAHFAVLHHILRKAGHFFGYGIMGWLWFRAFRNTLEHSTRLTCALIAIICTFAIACMDEWHQSYSSARTGQFSDVLLDTTGALTLVVIGMFILERRRQRRALSAL